MVLDQIVIDEINRGNSFLIGIIPINIENCMNQLECELYSDECVENCRKPEICKLQVATIGKQSKKNRKVGNMITFMVTEEEAKRLEEASKINDLISGEQLFKEVNEWIGKMILDCGEGASPIMNEYGQKEERLIPLLKQFLTGKK
jgi:hypothetical protein